MMLFTRSSRLFVSETCWDLSANTRKKFSCEEKFVSLHIFIV